MMLQKKFSVSKSIFWELLLAFVLVVLIPALIIGSVSAWSSYQIGRQRTLDQLDSVVTLKSAEIDMWTNELTVGLNMLVDEDDMNAGALPLLQEQLSPSDAKQAYNNLLTSLKLMVGKNQLFDHVFLMDEKGKVIVSTDPAWENQDLSGTDYYQQGLQKHFITPPFYTGLANDKHLVIVVSQPIIAPGQGAVGVLAGYSDLSVLNRIMEEPIGLGQTGESYLVGADYTPLTQLRFPTDSLQVKSDGISLAVEDKIRGEGMYRDYLGNPVIGVYTWLPTLQVALVVEQSQQEAFGSTITTLEINLGVALAAIALTVLVALLITRSVATPLTILSTAATQIAAGDLDHVADVNRQDEIGTLAQAFNRMTAQLRNLITELQVELAARKRGEEALRKSHQLLEKTFANLHDAVFILDDKTAVVNCNPAASRIFGYRQDEILGQTTAFLHVDESALAEFRQQLFSAVEAKGVLEQFEFRMKRRDGIIFSTEHSVMPLEDAQGRRFGWVSVVRDITARKQNEQRIQNQIKRLNALHDIDNAIKSNADLRITLEVLLEQVTAQLNVDAASVLLFNKNTLTLEYTASRGFRSTATQHTKLEPGEGYAGRVIMERRIIHVPELTKKDGKLVEALSLAGENFTAYVGVPLLAKGQIVGVLEIFQQLSLTPDREWFDYLETLAGQAAIAIDNAQLFENLQRSNFELTLSYDATIEGWSRAMELRDEVTEGHTQRVTTLTLELARQMGIPETELIHIRRGALLHDIGKIGIPDSILLKPGTLTDEEQTIMRHHPTYAYEMLTPIPYLRPALDIPYSHHEKWDGTGYPQGLKGGQIPLPARIFAIVDVWDALTSNRPYRPAWTKEKAIEYIREQSGKHFDPGVTAAFIQKVVDNDI